MNNTESSRYEDGNPGSVPLSEVVAGARKLNPDEIEKRIMHFV